MQIKLNLFRQIGNLLILLCFLAAFALPIIIDLGGNGSAFAQDSAQPVVPATSGAPAGQTGEPGQPPQPGWGSMLMPFVLMFGVIYFLMIRPQQKRMKKHQEMLGSLKRGDDVVTSSGLLGKVKGITDKVVTLEIDDNVHVRLLKSQVNTIVKGQLQDIQQN